jgi:hypothetical protein
VNPAIVPLKVKYHENIHLSQHGDEHALYEQQRHVPLRQGGGHSRAGRCICTATVPLKVKYHENIHLSSMVMNMLCINNNAMFPCVKEEDTAEQEGVYVQPLSL